MKATTEQLKKIDLSKCKLPKWRGKGIYAKQSGSGVVLAQPTEFCSETYVASIHTDEWQFHANGTWSQLQELLDISQTVDAFITSELAAIEEKEKPEPSPCPSKMHIVQTQTVPHHGPCEVGIKTCLTDKYRGKEFRVTMEEL